MLSVVLIMLSYGQSNIAGSCFVMHEWPSLPARNAGNDVPTSPDVMCIAFSNDLVWFINSQIWFTDC